MVPSISTTTIIFCVMMFARIAVTPSSAASTFGAQAEIQGAQGNRVGTAVFTDTGHGVQIDIKVNGLSPGEHGIHFHEKGQCDAPKFESAGAHFSSPGQKHGLEQKEHHLGDLPNLVVASDGTASTTMLDKSVSLDSHAKNSLLGKNGTALVIHANADDQHTQPSGASGRRIACGVVRATSGK